MADGVPSKAELFLGYVNIGLLGFGGVGPWSRHVIVEARKWLSERDYAEVLGLGQILPGPNVGNASVMIGRRFHGLAGSLIATAGLYIGPLCILIALSVMYELYGTRPGVAPFMQGVAAAAAGVVLGTAIKMAVKLKPTLPLLLVGLTALALALLRAPLPYVVLGLAPFGLAAAWWALRK